MTGRTLLHVYFVVPVSLLAPPTAKRPHTAIGIVAYYKYGLYYLQRAISASHL